jgi:hypothetical protein
MVLQLAARSSQLAEAARRRTNVEEISLKVEGHDVCDMRCVLCGVAAQASLQHGHRGGAFLVAQLWYRNYRSRRRWKSLYKAFVWGIPTGKASDIAL